VRALGVDKGDAVAKMSRVNAGELALVLARFHEWNGIDANVRRSATGTNDVDEFGRRGRRVEANLFAATSAAKSSIRRCGCSISAISLRRASTLFDSFGASI